MIQWGADLNRKWLMSKMAVVAVYAMLCLLWSVAPADALEADSPEAESPEADSLEVDKAWARATPPGATTAAIYGTLVNRGDHEVVIVSVVSAVAKMAMLHASRIEDGMMRMTHEPEVSIAPGARLILEPGGRHLMLMGLAGPLVEGQYVRVILNLEGGDAVPVIARVGSIAQTRYIGD